MIPTWYIALIPEDYEHGAIDRFARMAQVHVPEITLPPLPRHLTLVPPFKAPTHVAAKILPELRDLGRPFTAKTEGWGYFQDHRCWYLHIETRPEFIELENAGRERLAGRGLQPPIEPRIHHITLAKDDNEPDAHSLMSTLLARQRPPITHVRFTKISLIAKEPGKPVTQIVTLPFN